MVVAVSHLNEIKFHIILLNIFDFILVIRAKLKKAGFGERALERAVKVASDAASESVLDDQTRNGEGKNRGR